MKFIDIDFVIQKKTGRLLQAIINSDGPEAFKTIEEETILSFHCHQTVIGTRGCVVFSSKAMAYLKSGGIVICLSIQFEEMGP
ncbi:MAG: shikimate kinase [Methanomicrobiales archaeon]